MRNGNHNLEQLLSVRKDTSIPQSKLNLEDKTRSNLFPWNGQFSPELISVLLSTFGSSGNTILDPFMGSGTVLIEAARQNYRCFGSDVNPAPVTLAKIYQFANVVLEKRESIIGSFESSLNDLFDCDGDFLVAASQRASSENIKSRLVSMAESETDPLGKVLGEALIVLLDFYKPNLSVDKVFAYWKRLKQRVQELPYSKQKVTALNSDARTLPLRRNSVHLTITSPPYINVFNYHQMYRASVEALGWDLLHVARSEIGSNRKHRGNRFLTVVQYCLDIADALVEIRRVSSEAGRCIFIVGRESNVLKTPFFNAAIVLRIATEATGFSCVGRQERVFRNRFGVKITEDILHLVPNVSFNAGLAISPRTIGQDALIHARTYAPVESADSLDDAIESASSIEKSPIYKPIHCTTEAEVEP